MPTTYNLHPSLAKRLGLTLEGSTADAAYKARHDTERECPYCGPGPCRATVRTADGTDLNRYHRHHPCGRLGCTTCQEPK